VNASVGAANTRRLAHFRQGRARPDARHRRARRVMGGKTAGRDRWLVGMRWRHVRTPRLPPAERGARSARLGSARVSGPGQNAAASRSAAGLKRASACQALLGLADMGRASDNTGTHLSAPLPFMGSHFNRRKGGDVASTSGFPAAIGSQRGGRERSAPIARSETRFSFEPCGEPISGSRVRQLPGVSGMGRGE
jgi:hypothetical protein